MKIFFAFMAACGGGFLNYAGAWVVHRDSINYRLPVPLSTAAETAFALGPALWAVGLILAAPSIFALGRRVRQFWRIMALQAIAYITLVCGLGSVGSLAVRGFLGSTMLLWVLALVSAAVSPATSTQRGSPPNGGPPTPVGNSQVTEGPSVS
jgi:hypothetical protein